MNFPKPTNSTPELIEVALKLARQLYAPGYGYKKAGVVALATVDETVAAERQYLFDPDPNRPQERRDRDQRRAWRPNSSFVSPSYTSDWSFIPSAR